MRLWTWTPREWTLLAVCRNNPPDALFVRGAAQQSAKRVCTGCPVRLECLADALDNGIDHGVWGGMTDRERRALRRRHPRVRDWLALLAPTGRCRTSPTASPVRPR